MDGADPQKSTPSLNRELDESASNISVIEIF